MKQLRNIFIRAAIPHHYSSIFKTYSFLLIRRTTVCHMSDNKILDTFEICKRMGERRKNKFIRLIDNCKGNIFGNFSR